MYTSSINGGTTQAVNAYSASVNSVKAAETPEEESAVQTPAADQDTYTPSAKKESPTSYKMDAATVKQMKTELEEMKLRFLETVRKTIGKQVKYGQGAWKDISPEDQAAAQEAISEDGYWGVKQTSERIVSFAKALVGGDPSRVEEMRDAFVKGYQAAEKAWGGSLPEISRQTYDAVMKLFDEWAGKSDSTGGVESASGAESEEPE